MGITPRFSKTDILNYTEIGKQKIERGLLNTLKLAGETFVTEAREGLNISSGLFPKGDYKDRTANLRSSIGYFVLKDGEIIYENLLGTGEGEQAARAALNSVKDKSGYMLVGVAGMDYAAYVESKGYNVITSQADNTIRNMPMMLFKLRDRLKKYDADIDFEGKLFTTGMHRIE
jgi:hypothetical protein